MSFPSRMERIALSIMVCMPLLLAVTRAGADIALCLIDVLFLARSVQGKQWQWVRQDEIKAVFVFWLFIVGAALFSPVNIKSAFLAALIWGRFVLFYAAARCWVLRLPGAMKPMTMAGLITLALAAIDTLWQYKTGISLTGHHMVGEDRLTGPLTKANIGNYMLKVGLPMLSMASYLLVARGQQRYLWAPACGLMAVIGLIMISGERSTALLMLLCLGIMGFTLFASMPTARKWVAAAGAVIAALMALLGSTQPVVQQKIGYFIEQMSDFQHTPYGQLYTAAWRLWQQHPLTGIGPQQFLEACRPEALQVTYCDVHPHNMYMEWLVATGLPGLLLFIGAMALILRRFLREAPLTGTKSLLTACGLSEFAAVLFPFVVTQSVFSNWSAALFWYSLALGMSLLQLAPDTTHEPAH